LFTDVTTYQDATKLGNYYKTLPFCNKRNSSIQTVSRHFF